MSKQGNVTVSQSGGVGFVGLLTIVFIALKLTGNIDWSWVWVLSPIWISAVFTLIAFLIAAVIIVLVSKD